MPMPLRLALITHDNNENGTVACTPRAPWSAQNASQADSPQHHAQCGPTLSRVVAACGAWRLGMDVPPACA
jgi:hypothetical protein